ncbi:MAG: hypothetical protein K2H17_10530 [Duncaniella sp.]|uniref:hypothetical protein n=1 Tax=Duncaniella sp. TaxID=2518496 RepID=UPI0023BF7F75|nr:hypothetical protein [Duncaniella sp.]MDE5989816.1 hypothetical protein [Duncaniella sp.]
MNRIAITIFALFTTLILNAQIGYQVSLLDAATGQPRADETVSVKIDITDSTGALVCSETKSATSDDFGVLSLTIGNASTFSNADWSKLPFYISATVDNILLGKSQILNVPVAEYAKQTDSLDKKQILGRNWSFTDNETDCAGTISFTSSTAKLSVRWTDGEGGGFSKASPYVISGYTIITSFGIFAYNKSDGRLIGKAGDIGVLAH